jgi:hypothetical protein
MAILLHLGHVLGWGGPVYHRSVRRLLMPVAAAALVVAALSCSRFDAATSASPDGGAEGTAAEAGPNGQGGTRGCAALALAPKFCKDFDDNKPLTDGWDRVSEEAGSVTFDPVAFSPPRSAKVTLTGGTSCQFTRLEKSFDISGATRLEVHTRFRPAWKGHHAYFAMDMQNSADTTGCKLLFYLDLATGNPDDARLNVQPRPALTDDVRPLNGFPRVGEWTDVSITATTAANGPSVSIAFQHQDGTVDETTAVYDACVLGGHLGVYPGFHCDHGEADAWYDDIRVDWH